MAAKLTREQSVAESQVLIDALPYTDEGYEDEKVRESAARLIEEEVSFSFLFFRVWSF